MNSHDFLDLICNEVKYKSIHNAIRTELGAHIEEATEGYKKSGMDRTAAMETAVAQMGDAKEIGKLFNKQYRLPFNSRFGLSIWAAVVTMIIYIAYPFMSILWDSKTLPTPYSDFVIIGIIILFMAANVLYLRRGRKIIAIRDMAQITFGFLAGWLAAALILVYTSYINIPMHYVYLSNVRLPYEPPYLPFLPKEPWAFGMEGFSWWLCLIVYIVSVKSRKKEPFVITMYYTGNWADFTAGKPVIYLGSPIMGQQLDKYGEITTPFERSNKKGR